MKVFLLALGLIALCTGVPLPEEPVPTVPGDNSHYVEGVSRYIWMPDGDGEPHLVDLHEEADENDMNREARNGANNQYWLFTRRNPNNRQVIVNGNVNTIRNSNYNGNLPLKVIVHGWNSNGNSPVNPHVRDAFLQVQDCNVIVVDWNRAANQGYNAAARDVPDVGRHIGNFINWLIQQGGGNLNRVHIVGFSLGAHASGNAGRTLRNAVSRITGLDPAGPQWGGNGNALRASDAAYVEAIHTNGRALGIMDPIGRANFYPNGGRNQPGCALTNTPCSHGRAYLFMASTIRYNRAVGRQCVNLSQAELSACSGNAFNMGNGNLAKRGTGMFGLRSSDRWPFF